jgi:C1A family cysteine protease
MFNKIIVLLASLFILPNALHLHNNQVTTQFSEFIKTYDMNYSDEELASRFEIFRNNVEKINTHNTQGHSWKMGVNRFTAMTPEEFKNTYTGYNRHSNLNYRKFRVNFENLDLPAVEDLPAEVDWVSAGAVTPVKDQGSSCGSCWAFSTTGGVEGAYFLETGKLVSFSEQQLVDCDKTDSSCEGGIMQNAYTFLESNKLCTEKDYSYKGVEGICKKCTGVTLVDSYVEVTPNNELALQQALTKQPISVAVDATQLQYYQSGILSGSCSTQLNHGILLVSMGTDKSSGMSYYTIKNSWGTSWGENGFGRMQRNIKQKSGICGIATEPSFPVITKNIIF